MARWNKLFAQSTTVTDRPLPVSVYEGGRVPKTVTLQMVKKEIKALTDLMAKRYKAAVKKGVEHSAVEKYERGYWDKPSSIRNVDEGIKQIREMWAVITKVGTAKNALATQEEGYMKEYEGLKRTGWFDENEMQYEDFLKFRKFYGIYQSAYKESMYYQVLDDYATNFFGEGSKRRRFRKEDILKLVKRWNYWEKQAEAAGAKARERLGSGKFISADRFREL